MIRTSTAQVMVCVSLALLPPETLDVSVSTVVTVASVWT